MGVVLFFIAVNVIAFVLPFLVSFSGPTGSSFTNFLLLGWKNNVDIRDGEFYRFLTSTFLHSDIFHLFFNMYSLYQLGPTMIAVFGIVQFSIIYLVSGIAGSVASFFFNASPSIGASGSVFGLVGALLAFGLLTRQTSLLSSIAVIFLINFIYALDPSHRIDNYGHIGGLVAGFVLGLVFLRFPIFNF